MVRNLPVATRRRSMATFALLAGVAVAAPFSVQTALAQAPRPAASAANAHADISGTWTSRNKSIPEGPAAGFPIPVGTTEWAPLSFGRPQDVKIESYAVQKEKVEKVIAANGDVFAYQDSRRHAPIYTAQGQAAADARKAARASAKRGPYDQCLPRNSIGAFGAAGGGFGGAVEVFAAKDHLGVVSEDGSYRMIRLGKLDASKFAPTYAGTSVGRWEGGRLVVVTSNYLGEDANGWPMSPQAKVTDTIWLSPDHKTLNVMSVYEDPTYLKEPMARMLYLDRAKPNYEFLPVSCVETVQGAADYAETFGTSPPK